MVCSDWQSVYPLLHNGPDIGSCLSGSNAVNCVLQCRVFSTGCWRIQFQALATIDLFLDWSPGCWEAWDDSMPLCQPLCNTSPNFLSLQICGSGYSPSNESIEHPI